MADRMLAVPMMFSPNFTSEKISELRLPEPKSSEKKIDRAIRMLRENPEWKKKTVMSLEAETDIDHNTWSKAKKRV